MAGTAANATNSASAWLIAMPGGPALAPLELKAGTGALTIGRHENCPLRLPADADQVSRHHARFTFHNHHWRISDLRSTWGTFLNGVKLPPLRETPLGEGDLLRIAPWTFSFSTRGVPARGLHAVDDTASMTMVRSHGHDAQPQELQDDLLKLLLESASALHEAADEKALADCLIDVAARGTGLPNISVLRALDCGGRIEVIASRSFSARQDNAAPPGFSQSLLTVASGGALAELSAATGGDVSQSLIQMNVDAALCAPLMLGSTVSAYLYLDSRGASPVLRTLRPNAAGFCLALAKIAGLALANLKRQEMERRSAGIEFELQAAMAAQRWILPLGQTRAGRFVCSGKSRPGQYVGGDFFDTMVLPGNRLFVALGDVSGHGVGASILMTACQGFLHAAVSQQGDLSLAIGELNKFVYPRRPDTRFVTLWAALLDGESMTVQYVNAGHGYALLTGDGQSAIPLADGDCFPIGIAGDALYPVCVHPLPAHGRVLVISDGLVEQPSADSHVSHAHKQFGLDGVQSALAAAPKDGDAVAHLFQSVFDFGGTDQLSDDATAVLVSW
jgi:serine phosphatase RsbU (regulator of sigma subunit)